MSLMKLHSKASLWNLDKDAFSHTVIILQSGDDFFYASSPNRFRSDADVNICDLTPILIPPTHIYPIFPKHFTQALEPLPENCYIKRPELFGYEQCQDSFAAELLLQEATLCERLAQFPHPNIAQYLGCVVQEDRIKGLCFTRYNGTLYDRVRDGTVPDRDGCLLGIEAGLRHLHDLGLVHNDINPSNIMFTEDETPVIIDFNSCKPEGTEIGFKHGTHLWNDEYVESSHHSNDYYGLKRVREFLYEESSSV